jgi:hypothetical protein
LVKLMRQGQPSLVLSQELDVYESSQNKWVGSLSMMFTNEGKRISEDDFQATFPKEQLWNAEHSKLRQDQLPAS